MAPTRRGSDARQHASARERVFAPRERFEHVAADNADERVEAAHLLGVGLEVALILAQAVAPLRGEGAAHGAAQAT